MLLSTLNHSPISSHAQSRPQFGGGGAAAAAAAAAAVPSLIYLSEVQLRSVPFRSLHFTSLVLSNKPLATRAVLSSCPVVGTVVVTVIGSGPLTHSVFPPTTSDTNDNCCCCCCCCCCCRRRRRRRRRRLFDLLPFSLVQVVHLPSSFTAVTALCLFLWLCW